MKLTKERLIQIIKEEMGAVEEISIGNPGMSNFTDEPEKEVSGRTQWALELIKLSRDEIAKNGDISQGEVAIARKIVNDILEMMTSGAADSNLRAIEKRTDLYNKQG